MTMPAPLRFVPAHAPVRGAVTKVGGQPVWLEEPQWPVSRSTGEPMEFLGQFALAGGALAYLFMSADGHETWEPEAGENALVIQPGGRVPDFVRVAPHDAGPALGHEHLARAAGGETEVVGEEDFTFLGGPDVAPNWLQGEESPGEGWQLVVQLDSCDLPYEVNFGDAGIGYAFLSPDGKEGRFLWQCA